MKRKTQTAWAIVGNRCGWINHGSIRFTRKDVIKDRIEESRPWQVYAKYSLLSDAQFWRLIKRRQGITVRRIILKVAR